MRPTFTLGIEEEYQTIDPETRDLRSHIATEMLAQGKLGTELGAPSMPRRCLCGMGGNSS